MMKEAAHPLSWPAGWKRTNANDRGGSADEMAELNAALDEAHKELMHEHPH